MFPILAALASGLAFTALQILLKRHTSKHLTPLALPALIGLMAPLWLALAVSSHNHHLLAFNLTPKALIFPIFWAACTVTTTVTLVWLLSKFSLTEVAGYRKALITLGALSADILVFAADFPALKLTAIALLLVGVISLGRTRQRLPTPREALVLLLWCTLLTVQITLYKQGITYQPEVISHTILAQLFASLLYCLLWFSPQVRKARKPRKTIIFLMLVCAFTGVVLEGFAYAGLNLAAVMVLTILPATLFATHDLWRGDIRRNPRSYAALALVLAGIVLLLLNR